MRAAGAASGALHRRRGGGQGRRRPGGDVGRRPRERLARRPGADAVARPHLRLRVPLQGHVPLRARRRADQARPQQLRRHGHHLLLHLGGAMGCPRRGRPRVPGQRERAAVHAAHQRVRLRQRQQGAAVPPLVRPHHRLPHLLHRVDAAAHPVSTTDHTPPLPIRRQSDNVLMIGLPICSVLVDGTPIREFKNHADRAVPYPSSQQMRLYGSLWDAEDWATQGGRVKTDWSQAPFVAQYRNFTATAPAAASGYGQQMDAAAQQAMKWARDNYMVYDYCADTKRFPQGVPPECSMP